MLDVGFVKIRYISDTMESDLDNNKEVSVFNYGKFKIMLMANTYAQAQSKKIAGDYAAWFKYLRALKDNIKSKLDHNRLKELSIMEQKIVTILNMKSQSNSFDYSSSNKFNTKIMDTSYKLIDEYETIVNRLLDDKGYDSPTKKADDKEFED